VADVFFHQAQADGVQGLGHGRDLRQDVDAVLVFLDHPGNSPDLSLDPSEPAQIRVLVRRVAVLQGLTDTPRGYMLEGMDMPEESLLAAADAPQPQHGYTADKEAYLRRLRRIEGQVRGIARMVEEDKYCIDILTQVSAVTKALHAVSLGLVEEHIGHCVIGAASEPDPGLRAEAIDIKVKEAADAIGRLLR
jgi:DNA-binding FrmR family transcriptional regulator